MKFLVVEEQEGGCDYTIGCGICTSIVQGGSIDEVVKRIHDTFVETKTDAYFDAPHGHAADQDKPRSRISVYEVSLCVTLPLKAWRTEYEDKVRAESGSAKEKAERAEYERLQKKFGKT